MLAIVGGLLAVRESLAAPDAAIMDSFASGVEQPGARKPERIEHLPWSAPAAASAPGWRFDLFSPPEIVFEEKDGAYFRRDAVTAAPADPSVGLELRLTALRPESFPIRLIGHLGDTAEKRGVFEDRDSGEIFVAGSGQIPGRAIELFDLVARDEDAAEWTGVTAIVRTPGIPGDVLLPEGHPGETGRVRAVLEFSSGATRELSAGDSFEVEGVAYRLAAVDSAQRRVQVERRRAGSSKSEAIWIALSEPAESASAEGEEVR